MKYSTALTMASAAAVAAQCPIRGCDSVYDELTDVCLPLANGKPDFNAPCNGMLAIQYQCAFGPAAGLDLVNQLFSTTSTGSELTLPAYQSNSTQRDCICSSQFFNAVNGCLACQKGHGDQSARDVTPSYISSVSSAYCAASSTPTVGLADYLAGIPEPTSTNTAATSAFSDPIGNKTAVSLYYNAPVTGTSVYLLPTSTGAVKTSNGQIVATATTNNAAASSPTPAAAQGAGSKAQVAGAAGVVGLAALAFLL
ncbi:uncharacterized protein K489DRAFT_374983 [Dissoconium aciculare CBS 342.82]|jgi:hypothetical protein|uniref:Uncharacterized protein n=1 Tax=Dissoconium aciculare CBS 342.82 TaxID=1314786 RepID=A0A6J3MGA7_9PEZI|nr:uncharacterized protein K489DRAFT_374983 [Dissoconium aciculare CBS 342.82]KAF1826898.1 hypothetical protein K489DRAFT_374983 [Dissoconium aciculare CBS 342.82]